MDEERAKSLLGYWTILVKFSSKQFSISIIQVYALTADKSGEEHKTVCKDLGTGKICVKMYCIQGKSWESQ